MVFVADSLKKMHFFKDFIPLWAREEKKKDLFLNSDQNDKKAPTYYGMYVALQLTNLLRSETLIFFSLTMMLQAVLREWLLTYKWEEQQILIFSFEVLTLNSPAAKPSSYRKCSMFPPAKCKTFLCLRICLQWCSKWFGPKSQK